MKKVLTVGVFDYFHLGHLRVLEQAKEYGDWLIVAVQDGSSVLKYKPDEEVWYSTEERIELIKALRIVDDVVVYKDVDTIVQCVDYDVLALGEDQNHKGFQKAEQISREMGKDVVRLKRTESISSKDLKEIIRKR